jgi:phosphatidylserine/phosphatidylglycerophosphate/cardiolipin synthase-like enzyme
MLRIISGILAVIVCVATARAEIEVYFSPGGGCADAIVKAIESATNNIRVQAYEFTSPKIAQALITAKARGVNVRMLLDKNQQSDRSQYDAKRFLRQARINIRLDKAHAIAHNKVIIIDGTKVITGSYNFTKAAENENAENVLIISNPAIAAQYMTNWQAHASHSAPYNNDNDR